MAAIRLSSALWLSYLSQRHKQNQELARVQRARGAREASKSRRSKVQAVAEAPKTQDDLLSTARARAGRKGMWSRWHREQVVLEHMAQVAKIARDVAPKFARHLDIRELEQQGMVGLLQAARRYDPETGGNFAAFAYFRIRGAIIDANRRSAYREETHDSLQAIQERAGSRSSHGTGGPIETVVDTAPLADEVIAIQQAEKRLAAAIGKLPRDERQVLRGALRGVSTADLAEQQGVTVTVVRKTLAAARAKVSAIVRGE